MSFEVFYALQIKDSQVTIHIIFLLIISHYYNVVMLNHSLVQSSSFLVCILWELKTLSIVILMMSQWC